MGLLPEGSLSNYVKADSILLWPVPKHWHLDEAATVILPYVHAYYCLVRFFQYAFNSIYNHLISTYIQTSVTTTIYLYL